MIFRTTSPFTRFNNDLTLTDQQRAVYVNYYQNFNNQTFVDPRISGTTNDKSTYFTADFLLKSFVYVITETVGDYPHPYFSEKTWKGINTGCAFMLVGARHSLAKLHDFGFKTFSNYWSESYDSKITVADRIECIVKELDTLAKLSIAELTALRNDIMPILNHNHQHLATFIQQDLANIAKSI